MRDKNLITPVRTRGALRTSREDIEENVASTPVRTRGAVRARGAVPSLKPRRSITLDALLQGLRKEVGDLPLTLLVHGWGSEPSGEFVATISAKLGKDDALWLIQSSDLRTASAPPEWGGVVLDLSRDMDQGVYRNLIGDVVFFPALEAGEDARAGEWRQRARAVIVDGRGPVSEDLLRSAYEVGLETYGWSGRVEVDEYRATSY